MLRAAWIVCVVTFTAFAIACGTGPKTNTESTESLKRTDGAPDTPTDERVEGLDKPAIIGGLRVRVTNAKVGHVETLGGISQDELLTIGVELVSVDPGKKFNYKSWVDGGKLTDDLGNKYAGMILPAAPIGRTVYATIYTDKSVRDVLVFERPVRGAKHLDLDLPAPIGGGRVFRFRIATDEVK